MSASSPDYLKDQLLTMAPHRALLRSIESRFMASVPLNHPVLDVGCGDGHFASVTFTEPIDVGMDPWQRDLLECATLGSSVYKDLVLGSATEMPFADESFQTVVSNSVLEHIPDVEMTVREIARVLKPGGACILSDVRHEAEYAGVLRAHGVVDLQRRDASITSPLFAIVSLGRVRPFVLIGRKTSAPS